jgi:hypothetical protein
MTILANKPYRDITPEEVREFIRLAHAERAAVIRHTFASLLWWRRKAAVQRTAADPALKVAHAH